MTTRHPARQTRVFTNHGRCRPPCRVFLFHRHVRNTMPTAFLVWDSDRITGSSARLGDMIKSAITKADNDFTRSIFAGKANSFASATPLTGPAPVRIGLRINRKSCGDKCQHSCADGKDCSIPRARNGHINSLRITFYSQPQSHSVHERIMNSRLAPLSGTAEHVARFW